MKKPIVNNKSLPFNHRKIWTEEEDIELSRVFEETRKVCSDGSTKRWTPDELAKWFQRTKWSILGRLYLLGLIVRDSWMTRERLTSWRVGYKFYAKSGFRKP
jgi:hypothetical protein